MKIWTDLPRHPKSDLLEVELGVERAWTYVVELWLWASDVQPDGDLKKMPPQMIARRSGWRGDAEQFVAALQKCGFLDGDMVLHGWRERQSHFEKVEQDRARKRPSTTVDSADANTSVEIPRNLHGNSAEAPRKFRGSSMETPRRLQGDSAEKSALDRDRDRDSERDSDSDSEGEGDQTRASARAPAHTRSDEHPPIESDEATTTVPVTPSGKPIQARRGVDGSWRAPNRERGIAGLMETQTRPKSIVELMAHPTGSGQLLGDMWRARFTCLDGRGGRPTLEQALDEPWAHWQAEGWHWQWPHQAIAKITSWLEDKHREAKRDRIAEAGAQARGVNPQASDDDPLRRRMNDDWRRIRERNALAGVKTEPFESWFAQHRAHYAAGGASLAALPEPSDNNVPAAEVFALMRGARKKAPG